MTIKSLNVHKALLSLLFAIASGCVPMNTAEMRSVTFYPSMNFGVRKSSCVNIILIHYTAIDSLDESLARLCDSNCENRVSAHYLIDRDGSTYQLVEESKRAWHAGRGRWRDVVDVNSASIGIELVNRGVMDDGRKEDYPEPQINALIELCKNIMARYDIQFVLGHGDVAPDRKQDPAENFPWKIIAAAGIGEWTDKYLPSQSDLSNVLKSIGYDVSDCVASRQAFVRHWCSDKPNMPEDQIVRRATAVYEMFLDRGNR